MRIAHYCYREIVNLFDLYIYSSFCQSMMDKQKTSVSKFVFMVCLILSSVSVDYITDPNIRMGPAYILICFYISWHGMSRTYIYLISAMTILWIIHDISEAFYLAISNLEIIINLAINITTIIILVITMSAFHRAVKMSLSANIDPLTEIFSRKINIDIMPVLVSELRRNKKPMSLMFIDCDNFKYVNDTFGHAAGDAVLQVVASCLTKSIRKSDLPARLGGDEFIVIFPEACGDHVKSLVERCISNLNLEMKEREWPITFSVGVVEFETPPINIEFAIRLADNAMYDAKRRGKDQVVYRLG